MINTYCFLLLFMLASYTLSAQKVDFFPIADSIIIQEGNVIERENKLINDSVLFPFFRKLRQLEKTKTGKINIVHIGDSHIQTDYITKVIRDSLQKNFGNAGRGLIFPYVLAKTNGPLDVAFISDHSWENYRNIYPVMGYPVGLSGITLFTKNKDFTIEIKIKDTADYFNIIKVITPKNENMFDLAFDSKTILKSIQPKIIRYKIKRGDVLSTIASRYNTTVAALKKINHLSSNMIKVGETLQIATSKKETTILPCSRFVPITLKQDLLDQSHFYKSMKQIDKFYLLSHKKSKVYALNGLILEKNQSGILYHNIGVNGAKFSDYNKYPLFFDQLKVLNPDMIILSLGTNESFDKLQTAVFVNQMNLFLEHLKKVGIDTGILITTPPPSLSEKKSLNVFAADYAQAIVKRPTIYSVAVWDLFSIFGGLYGISQNFNNGLMMSDKVHYSKRGYIMQGQLLNEVIMKAYFNFKNPIQN